MKTHFKASLIVIIFTSLSSATIINVPADQLTIQAGIDAAIDGDTVLVQPGTYIEDIGFRGKNIVVGSLFLTTGDLSYILNTVIEGTGSKMHSVVTFAGGEDSRTVLTGFTITKGRSMFFGSGILCNGSSPTLMNLIVIGNGPTQYGGGICAREFSNPTLMNLVLSGNSAHLGGGIYTTSNNLNLVNVTIFENPDDQNGYGIFSSVNSNINLINSILWNNKAQNPTRISQAGVNTFFCNIKGGWPGIGNIDADPMFADIANGDYRLLEGSPCIDAGIQDTMIVYNDGQDTLYVSAMDYMGSAPDIGAFESDPDNPIIRPSSARIINVPADQPTIQAGIDAANEGDTVLVQPGRYFEYISWGGKNIVVGSLYLTTEDHSYISDTVIDGNGDWRVISIWPGVDSTSELNGFTITNGNISYAAGVFCIKSSPTLKNLIICDNAATYGAGISCWDFAHPKLFNVTISGNTGYQGVGIWCLDSEISLVNSIVWNNSLFGIRLGSSSVHAFYSHIYGGYDGIGISDTYPMFADTAYGDYRILEGSPCIDAGIQDTMIVYNDGQDTLYVPAMDYMGSAPDIGAFESDPDNPLSNILEPSYLPDTYSLSQNYPNPFNPSTKINFTLPKSETVRIEIYNIKGQKIETLLNRGMPSGNHQVEFSGQNLSSGVYLYRIEAGEYKDVKKMILLH